MDVFVACHYLYQHVVYFCPQNSISVSVSEGELKQPVPLCSALKWFALVPISLTLFNLVFLYLFIIVSLEKLELLKVCHKGLSVEEATTLLFSRPLEGGLLLKGLHSLSDPKTLIDRGIENLLL